MLLEKTDLNFKGSQQGRSPGKRFVIRDHYFWLIRKNTYVPREISGTVVALTESQK